MIHNQKFSQFERSLIIIDDGASASYIEGCKAPIFLQDSLHVAVIEIIVLKKLVLGTLQFKIGLIISSI